MSEDFKLTAEDACKRRDAFFTLGNFRKVLFRAIANAADGGHLCITRENIDPGVRDQFDLLFTTHGAKLRSELEELGFRVVAVYQPAGNIIKIVTWGCGRYEGESHE